MKRRAFLRLAAGVAATWPAAAPAQKDASAPVIATLVPGGAEFARQWVEAVRADLKEMDLVESAGCALALRFADGDFSRLPGLAIEQSALGRVAPKLGLVLSSHLDQDARRSRCGLKKARSAPSNFRRFSSLQQHGARHSAGSGHGQADPWRVYRLVASLADEDRMRGPCRFRGNEDRRPRNQHAAFRIVSRAARIRCRGGSAGLPATEGSLR